VKCDVLALGAHIWSVPEGMFVTTDMHDFHRHIERLRERVPTLRIVTPADALDEVKKLSTPMLPTE
jgi:hypothetical protein